jgi:superfamily II DNA or RNA helicase
LLARNGCGPSCYIQQNGPHRVFDQLARTINSSDTPTTGKKQEPRPYQTVIMDDIRAKYRSTALRVLLQLPTGAGKTFCFCRIAAGAFAKGRRVWLLGHRAEIIEQISGALYMLGIEHGVLEGGQR